MKTIATTKYHRIALRASRRRGSVKDVVVIDASTKAVLCDFKVTHDGLAKAALYVADLEATPDDIRVTHLTISSLIFGMESSCRSKRDQILRSLADQMEDYINANLDDKRRT